MSMPKALPINTESHWSGWYANHVEHFLSHFDISLRIYSDSHIDLQSQASVSQQKFIERVLWAVIDKSPSARGISPYGPSDKVKEDMRKCLEDQKHEGWTNNGVQKSMSHVRF